MADISLNELASPASLDEFGIVVAQTFDTPFEAGTQAVDPSLQIIAPLGASTGTQTKWVARLSLSQNDGVVSRIIIAVYYPTGVFEVAYINDAFTTQYNGSSTLVQTSPGVFDISMVRNAGWPGSPRIFIHANTNRGGMTQ